MHYYDDPTTNTNNKEQQKKDTPSALSARIQKMVLNLGCFDAGLFVSYLSKPQKNTSKAAKDHEREREKSHQWIRGLQDDLKSCNEEKSKLLQQIRYYKESHTELLDNLENRTSELKTERKAKEAALKRVDDLQNELDQYAAFFGRNSDI
jgi:chromosome segregation ATPase